MSSIGKSPRLVNRVKSEVTITGRRSDTLTSTTPSNSKIPVSRTSLTPQTASERKKFLNRRKSTIGDAVSHLTRSSPSSKVRNIIYDGTSEKANASCDPELQGTKSLYPKCIFVNVCREHAKNPFRWREFLKRLWIFVGKFAQLVVVCAVAVMTFIGALHVVCWMLGGKSSKRYNEGVHAEDEIISDKEEDENAEEEKNQALMVLNPNGFSLSETTYGFSLIHFIMMIMGGLFNWIGGILMPGEA
ncbi:uncharacterized protein LOC126560360 [Anopheles maculipalpis]|uniref:uncharacterized protein LOC126560360 n=1 Tax=Anopheles maculipalpis TaxID=1496333 RepID=UPI002159A953|nr:uncharacterized protein LOC126560360 [Anopheles maculipalpis]